MDAIEVNNSQQSSSRVTAEQREMMLSFMKEHPSLATGRFSAPDGAKQKARLLSEMTIKLNSLGKGGTKTEEKWNKCWTDWKSDVKKKAGKIKRHCTGTGGGPPCKIFLTPLEEDLLNLIGNVVVTGESVPDSLDMQLNMPDNTSVSQSERVPVIDIQEGLWTYTFVDSVSQTTASTVPVPFLSPDIASSSLSSHASVALPTPSERSATPSPAASAIGGSRRKRRRVPVESSILTGEEILTRNAEALQKQVSVKERKLEMLEKFKLEELALKEREIDIAERNAEAAVRNAAAMETMAVAVTAAMQTLQEYFKRLPQ